MVIVSVVDTTNVGHHISANAILRMVERTYDGGGTIVVLADGSRIETYTRMTELHERWMAKDD